MVKLADRLDKIKPSKTMEVMALAKDLKAQGVDIVDLGAGEPDFPTPEYIRDLATEAMAAGYTKYTKVDGIPELKEAIAVKLKRDNNLSYSAEQIIVTSGAKQAIYNAMMAVVNEGDEVIILSPYWVSFPEIVKLADGEPVFAELDPKADYRRTLKPFEDFVTDKTVAVILNSPSNPVGSLLNDEFIADVIEIAREKDLLIISDETYERITFENKYKSIAAYEGGIDVTLTVNSMSKTYSMTGWRLGFAAGAKELIKAMSKIQSQTTSNANSMTQKASVETLKGDQSVAEMMRNKYWERRDVVYEGLSKLPGIEVNKPEGSFFIFPDVSSFYGKSVNGQSINGSVEFAEFLIEHAKVIVIPGEAFGSDNNVRISFAAPKKEIEKGIKRIGEALSLLH
ncbi:MAG: pyridoxal phosphate-dependent aminotransferase [Candidatus Marinimicrobia bacterium]|nr:pyridoxal phosphate-dependent aminotransferase [Candidatus Neomarinimicrobiota bacterium]